MGWIAPIYGIPSFLPEARYHGGDVYVHWSDIQDPRPGSVVTFRPYVDGQGFGAESCVRRRVVRYVLPRDTRKMLTLPVAETNPCAQYLPTSIFYTPLEEKGVTLRKYLWDGPLILYELWGEPQAILDVADDIGLLSHTEAEVLVSRQYVKPELAGSLRDIPESDLPKVPPQFRVAMSLEGQDVRGTLLEILGV